MTLEPLTIAVGSVTAGGVLSPLVSYLLLKERMRRLERMQTAVFSAVLALLDAANLPGARTAMVTALANMDSLTPPRT